ncbi:MAG TPA: hypothetical protein VLK33_08995 [Terriglobales bacterium]|nr:hypothetical protein [Terriglobales bacterium]
MTIQSEDALHTAEMNSVEVAGYSDTDFTLTIEANGESGCYTSSYFCSSAIWATQDVAAGPYDVTVSGSMLSPVNSLRITASVNLHRTTGNFISAIHVFGTTSDTPTPTATFPFITATLVPSVPPFQGGGLPTNDSRPPCTSTPVSDPTSTATQRAMIPTMSLPTVILPHATIPVATLTMGATVPNTPTRTPTGDPTTTLEPTGTPDGNCRILQNGGTAPPVVDFSLSNPNGGTCGSVFPEIDILIAPITSVLGIDLPIHFNGLNIQAHRIDICVDFQDVKIRFGDVDLSPFINAIFVILFVGMILQFRREL